MNKKERSECTSSFAFVASTQTLPGLFQLSLKGGTNLNNGLLRLWLFGGGAGQCAAALQLPSHIRRPSSHGPVYVVIVLLCG